jgi:hypothetical protein
VNALFVWILCNQKKRFAHPVPMRFAKNAMTAYFRTSWGRLAHCVGLLILPTPVRGLPPALQIPLPGLGDEGSRFDNFGLGNTLFQQPLPSQSVYNPPVPRREENKEGGNFPSILIACFLFILFEACRHRRRRDRD